MNRIRILSDLHLDVNANYPIEIDDKSIFTIICGDTSGYPDITYNWVKNNIERGIIISGNHLPYNDLNLTIQQLRDDLHSKFKLTDSITYLDAETSVFSKEVDGILFVGSCFYTNMALKHDYFNPTGDVNKNCKFSQSHMNDYVYGIKEIKYPFGTDNNPAITHITAKDTVIWFQNAFSKIDELLSKNEQEKNPKPVILISHHPLITNYFSHNYYIDEVNYSIRSYNMPSYASDMENWIKSHRSIKAYVCGHIHDIQEEFRSFYIKRDDGTQILVINNSRGYVSKSHDYTFNANRFIDVKNWRLIEIPESPEQIKKKKDRLGKLLKYSMCFI